MNQGEKLLARQYLLGIVSEGDAEQIELRLLTDAEYADAFKMLVNQITDEYVDGAFQDEELRRVEEVFFKSNQRREKLYFARALKRVQSEQRPQIPEEAPSSAKVGTSPSFRFYLPIAAGVLLLVGISVGLWRFIPFNSETNEALAALNSAYSHHRPIEARISALSYAPFSPTRGAANEDANKAELDRAELTLLTALRDRPAPKVHHALGQVYLAKRQYDDAIKEFNESLKTDTGNALAYSDLGAAWLEKGKANPVGPEPGKSLEAFARSLENFDRALELDPSLLAALFNRAIVHQYLMLPDAAEADWQEYLSKDSTSGWSNEARDNLKKLQNQKSTSSENTKDFQAEFLTAFREHDTVRGWEFIRRNRNASGTGKLIRDQLLDAYLQLSATGEREEAQTTLQALAFLGQIEMEHTHDVYTSQLAQFYASTTPKQRDVLIDARQLITTGQSYHAQSKPSEALPLFEKSKQLFVDVGDYWEAKLAEMWIGFTYNNTTDREQSISILSELASDFERLHYKWLHMRVLHLLSGPEYNTGKYSRAIDHNRDSLAIAEQIEDARGAFNTTSILIEQYRYIGNYEQSLDCIQRSLLLLNDCDLNAPQLGQYFSIIAAALSSAAFDRAAADYQRVALKIVSRTGQAQTLSRAYANLGNIYGRLGKYDEALQQANQGYETAKSLSDERVRKAMMAYSAQRIGDLQRQAGNIYKANDSYRECVELYKSLGNYYGVYEAHKSLLLSHLSSGNDEAAGEELETTLGLIEAYRSQILEEDNRNHFFGNEQSIYDLAIEYEYSRKNNTEKAFNFSEASRSRSLLDLTNAKSTPGSDSKDKSELVFRSISQPLSLSDIQRQMPREAQIVQYAVLRDKLLIWVISNTTIHSAATLTTQDELQKKVSRYIQLITDGASSETETNQVAKELFSVLIRPIESLLDKQKVIYFVPDKALNWLPFGALVSPESGRFLIQDYSSATTPSSTLFITSSNLARTRANSGAERILTIGNPRFSNVNYPALADLPAAKTEAEEIASLYTLHSVLTGSQATKRSVETEMERANIIQFAGHSIVNPHLPLLSKLVLANQKQSANRDAESSDLEARDIYKMNLAQTKLVVLSSCESGLGKYYAGEGVMNLARPFLAAKVPLVVASLWPVDSETTAELMISFHKHRKRGKVSTVQALRQAQLDLMSSSSEKARRVYAWAPFITVGGWAEF